MATIVVVQENMGPMHVDRLDGLAAALKDHRVVGIEELSESPIYSWRSEAGNFERYTLFELPKRPRAWHRLTALARARWRIGRGAYFLSNYDRHYIFAFSILLRLTGCRVFTMVNSQFIDRPRMAVREALKRFYFLPYNGALAAGARSKAYVEFLGMRGRATGACNTLGVRRIRELAGVFAPKTEPGDGGFITVARFVPEKNLGMLLEAYAGYRKKAEHPRGLSLYGGGPLEAELRSHASALGIGAHVQFFPFLQRDEIAKAMANSVGLILPSIMEPFGNVVIEAQAVGIPVLVSDRCGSADLVEDLINGHTFAPDCPEALTTFMVELLERPGLWGRMAASSFAAAMACDVDRLVEAVRHHARVEV